MTEVEKDKLTVLLRRKFMDIVRQGLVSKEPRAVRIALRMWERWLRLNGIHSRMFDEVRPRDGNRVMVLDPGGFKALFVPVDFARRALVLDFLP